MTKAMLLIAATMLAACATRQVDHDAPAACNGAENRQRCAAYAFVSGPDGRDLEKTYGVTEACDETPWLRDANGEVAYRSNGREGCVGIGDGITCCPESGKLDGRF